EQARVEGVKQLRYCTSCGADAMEVNSLSGTFQWQIDGFSELTEVSVYSNTFLVGGYSWQLLVHLENGEKSEDLSLYLYVANAATLQPGWTKRMDFVLTVVNQFDRTKSVKKGLVLDVKGCKDVYASLDKYVEVQNLDGNTKFYAEQHGAQDARKGVLFVDLPPVLQLHMKRFEYNPVDGKTAKVKDRCEFPLELNLDKESGKYLTPNLDKTGFNRYLLHSFLVHTDGVDGSHCYALIRPNLGSQWLKFDNEEVTKEEFKGEDELYTNAYMLVYIRQSDREKILCSNDVNSIAQPLQDRLKLKKREGDQLTEIKVAREEDLRQQIGRNIYLNLVDHALVRNFRVHRDMPFSEFKAEVKREMGIPVARQRFWVWGKEPSTMSQPIKHLSAEEEETTVEMLRRSFKKGNMAVHLFLQATPPSSGRNKDDLLLFLKLYDPTHSAIRYAGHLLVKSDSKPADVINRVKKLCGLAANEDVYLFEERNFGMDVECKPVDASTFEGMELKEAGILCVQKALTAAQKSGLKHPDMPSYLEFVQSQQVVHFRRRENPREDAFCLLLSKQDTYDKVVERLAEKLGLADPLKIRLTAHNCYSLQPRLPAIKYQGAECLGDMLAHNNQ
ncbi:unnamed protein product, partial [Closterium sp. Naga37s-1]